MLWAVVVILLVLWLLGLRNEVGGGFIHALFVLGGVVLVHNLISGRRARN